MEHILSFCYFYDVENNNDEGGHEKVGNDDDLMCKKIPKLQEGLKVLKLFNEGAYVCHCYGH